MMYFSKMALTEGDIGLYGFFANQTGHNMIIVPETDLKSYILIKMYSSLAGNYRPDLIRWGILRAVCF